MRARKHIVTVNGGSSTIRFACYGLAGGPGTRGPSGKVEWTTAGGGESLLKRIDAEIGLDSMPAVGHRIVHGMRHSEPAKVTPELLEQLRGFRAFDPEH